MSQEKKSDFLKTLEKCFYLLKKQFALILETSAAVLNIKPRFSPVSELENLYTRGRGKEQNKMAEVNYMPRIFILNEGTDVGNDLCG